MIYESPEMTILGSVEELTLNHGNNKVGTVADVFSPALVGSVVPHP